MPAASLRALIITLMTFSPINARWTTAEEVRKIVLAACRAPSTPAERALCSEVAALRSALAGISALAAEHEAHAAAWTQELAHGDAGAHAAHEAAAVDEATWHAGGGSNGGDDEAAVHGSAGREDEGGNKDALFADDNGDSEEGGGVSGGGSGGELCVPGGGGGGSGGMPHIEFSGFFSTSGSGGLDSVEAAEAFANMQAMLQGLTGSELPSVIGDGVKVELLPSADVND